MYSEEEARKKWCAMYQVGGNFNNRDDGANTNCIASDCAMWRTVNICLHCKQEVKKDFGNHQTYGYCGLAGKP